MNKIKKFLASLTLINIAEITAIAALAAAGVFYFQSTKVEVYDGKDTVAVETMAEAADEQVEETAAIGTEGTKAAEPAKDQSVIEIAKSDAADEKIQENTESSSVQTKKANSDSSFNTKKTDSAPKTVKVASADTAQSNTAAVNSVAENAAASEATASGTAVSEAAAAADVSKTASGALIAVGAGTTSASSGPGGSSSGGSSSGSSVVSTGSGASGGSGGGSGSGTSGGSSVSGGGSGSGSQKEDPVKVPEEDDTLTCTVMLSCAPFLDDVSDKIRAKLPSDGIILAETEVEIREGDSVYDVLKRVCKAKHIPYKSSMSYYGAYVSSMDNLSEKYYDYSTGWCYYVDGEYANVSSDQWALSGGESIEWIYDSWSF